MTGTAAIPGKSAFLAVGLVALSLAAPARAEDPAKITGPNACAECHKNEATVWKDTHHATTFNDMPRSKAAREIANKLGIRRIKTEALCLTCHFTSKTDKDGDTEAIAGITCESCHGEGKDWIKVHSGFSGKKEETETAAEEKARWEQSESLGMIRPENMYRLAKNCYSCHVVPRERLVNAGGHPAGSPFELVAWSQGEVRHNMWYSEGKENKEASPARKRLMFVVGLAVEAETALRAVGKATAAQRYAQLMAKRADIARKKVAALAKVLSDVPELETIAQAANAAGLKLNNEAELTGAADKVAAATKALVAKYDGGTFGSIDKYLPKPAAYKGKPAL